MSELLSGLESLGLNQLVGMKLYDDPQAEEAKKQEAAKKADPVLLEQDLLLDKTHTCPVCDKEFKAKTVKSGKAKLLGQDVDLRPRHEGIDMAKYDVLVCPNCGYAALSRYFKSISSKQAEKIKEAISKNYKAKPETGAIYTYEMAVERYKLALVNAIVKQAKNSEKAYICLKTAWLIRGQGENLKTDDPEYEKKKAECLKSEEEFLKNALDGFIVARQSEGYPMCGMDESTLDYLIAVIALRFNQFDVTAKLIAGILGSTGASPRMKDKARELKETLMQKIKEQKAGK